MKSPIRITNMRGCGIMFVILLAFYLLAVIGNYQNTNRVHPDEVEVRDWIASVQGSFESRLDPERHITIVRLNRCHITDDDLIRLVPLSHLRELDLSNTDITDEAIPTILSMAPLFYLTIKNTKMTREGYMRMFQEGKMSIEVTFRAIYPEESE